MGPVIVISVACLLKFSFWCGVNNTFINWRGQRSVLHHEGNEGVGWASRCLLFTVVALFK